MALTEHFQEWYTSGSHAPEAESNVAEAAFRAAVKQFTDDGNQGKHVGPIMQNATSLRDVQEVVGKSMDWYQARGKNAKTIKWLQRTVKSITHYSNVFDVFAEQSPAYASLAWGVMKFLFMAVAEHEKTVALLAKSIAQIAESLPRVHLSSGLYPTPRMKIGLEELYASILKFLMKAYDWYNEGTRSHIFHSITRPLDHVYADVIDEIAEKSRRIDQLAVAGSQAELRDMHKMLAAIQSQLKLSDTKMEDILGRMASYHAIQSSTMLDTNQRVSDLQISQILTFLSDVPLDDPLKSLQYHIFFRNRRSSALITNLIWLSSRFQSLFSTEESALAVMRGNFACRQVLRDLCVDIIGQLRSSNTPTLWALKKVAAPNNEHSPFSIIDLLKYLIFQAMRLNESLKTEKAMAWHTSQFHRATTAAELFQLLLAALNGLGRQVYLVIDLETVEESLQSLDGFNIVSAFLQAFHATHPSATRLKVMIVRYRAISLEMPLMNDAAFAVFPVKGLADRRRGKKIRRRIGVTVRSRVDRRGN